MRQITQIFQTFKLVAEHDKQLIPLTAAILVGTAVVFTALAWFVQPWWMWILPGLLVAVTGIAVLLGRRTQAYQVSVLEGQPGAAAAMLQQMRGVWEVTPGVAFNRRQDMVHLLVGRAGVVLVGEGSSRPRVKQLLAKASKRIGRAAGDVPVHEVFVGDGEDDVALKDLTLHVARLPRAIKADEVGPLNKRLSTLKSSSVPMPKGPQNMRVPRKRR